VTPCWVEVFQQQPVLNTTPLVIADIFRSRIDGGARWIFTSATLAVGDFTHYQQQMGLEQATAAAWDSPFDYPTQALLYVPQRMPGPNTEGYTRAVVDAVLPVLAASRGRAFLLFTSLRAMREAHTLLLERFAQQGMTFRCCCRERARAASCSIAFGGWAMRCWWRVSRSGRGSTCAARRCRW
jgi:ATP-dependent DNA helicase DinG